MREIPVPIDVSGKSIGLADVRLKMDSFLPETYEDARLLYVGFFNVDDTTVVIAAFHPMIGVPA